MSSLQVLQQVAGEQQNAPALGTSSSLDVLQQVAGVPDFSKNPPGVPKPQIDMKESKVGNLISGPSDVNPMGSKVPESIKNAPDEVGDTIAGITGAATGAAAAAPVLENPITRKGVEAIGDWADKNPKKAWLAYLALAHSGLLRKFNQMQQMIAEVGPLFLIGGGKGGAGAAEAEEAEGAAAESQAAGGEAPSQMAPAEGTYRVTRGAETSTVKEEPDIPLSKERADKIASELKPTAPDMHKRGPNKGEQKVKRVFFNGEWHEVPQYK